MDEPVASAEGERECQLTDRSGWPPHPSERRDFYHRIRVFPADVAAWRKGLYQHVKEHPERFPLAADDRERLFEQLDKEIKPPARDRPDTGRALRHAGTRQQEGSDR